MSILDTAKIIKLPKVDDTRGNLTFIEGNEQIPFRFKRAYWMYDVPGGQVRAGHAYHQLQEFVISLSGSFDVVLDCGNEKRIFSLNRSYYGLYIPRMIWRHFENFSTNSMALILASDKFDETDYIRDFHSYKALVKDLEI